MKYSRTPGFILIFTFFLITLCVAKDDDDWNPKGPWVMSWSMPLNSNSPQQRTLSAVEQSRIEARQNINEEREKIHQKCLSSNQSTIYVPVDTAADHMPYYYRTNPEECIIALVSDMESFSKEDFKSFFRGEKGDIKYEALKDSKFSTRRAILHNYEFYRFKAFLEYAREFPEWEEVITELYFHLRQDKEFAKSTHKIEGFISNPIDCWNAYWQKNQSKFQKTIEREYDLLQKKRQEKREQHNQELKQCSEILNNVCANVSSYANEKCISSQEKFNHQCIILKNHFEAMHSLQVPQEFSSLIEVGKECITETMEAEAIHNVLRTERAFKRAESAYKTILNNRKIHEETYSVTQKEARTLILYSGTDFQHTLHQELIASIEEAAPLFKYRTTNEYADGLATYLTDITRTAYHTNNEDKKWYAMSLSDYVDSISKVGQRFANFLESGGDLAQKLAYGSIEGIAENVVKYGADWVHCITNPPDAFIEYLKSLRSSVSTLAKIASATYDSERRTKIVEFTKSLLTLAREDPQNAARHTMGFFTQAVLNRKLDPKIFTKGSALLSYLQKEAEALKKVGEGNEKLKKILAPISTTFEKTQKTLNQLDQYKNVTLEELTKLKNKLPKFLRKETTYQEFSELKQKSPHVTESNYVHIFHGELELQENVIRLRKGLHTKKGCEKFIKQSKIPQEQFHFEELSNGVIRVILPEEAFLNKNLAKEASFTLSNGNQINKVKTLWPAHYSEEKILEEAAKIISQPSNKYLNKNQVFIGYTSDNIKAKVCIDKYGNITTAYPVWEQ